MKKTLFCLLIAATTFACNNTAPKKENKAEDKAASLSSLSDKEKAFIAEFALQHNKPVYVVSTTRNRYFTKKGCKPDHCLFHQCRAPGIY